MDNSTVSESCEAPATCEANHCNFCAAHIPVGHFECDDEECDSGRPDPDPSCSTCDDHGFQSYDCPDCGK